MARGEGDDFGENDTWREGGGKSVLGTGTQVEDMLVDSRKRFFESNFFYNTQSQYVKVPLDA